MARTLSVSSSVLVLTLLLGNFRVFSGAQKIETTFPAGTPATDQSSELVASLRMINALPAPGRLTQCTGFVLTNPSSNPFWVLQITGHAPSTTVHHLVLYGCTSQPSTPCACNLKQRTTIFVSAKNTPPIRFPAINDANYFFGNQQAGLQIGGNSSIQYVFLEVHYAAASNIPDSTTGVDLQYTTTALEVFVGILSLMGVGTIPAGNSGYNVDSCVRFTPSGEMIDIFGYQVHTHERGRLVSIYVNPSFTSNAIEIGRGDPLSPQAYMPYHPITSERYYTFYDPDIFLLRCVFNASSETSPTNTIGIVPGQGTEMCFGNVLYATNALPTPNSFPHGNCAPDQTALFPAESTQLLPSKSILKLHALYGNQTGAISIDASRTMNLDLENFPQ